ncbi:MAG TPA: M67 family metallopeptidase [Rhizomicrobium sp.]|jgi:proteasome lid subunit RPN8/RPN11|nr:M67 family metallopeptidase [Rhizomicrobium sp.]
MIQSLALPAALREQLKREARAAFPRECCGLIEGRKNSLTLSQGEAAALHTTPNLARESGRFEIDPAAHIALLRKLRGTGGEIIGCYHSHPDGRSEPSPRDVEGAGETDFLWLIAAIESASADVEIACFVWTGANFAAVRVETD